METTNQQPMGNQLVGNPPDNHLVWAIISTVACCLPLGIVSIIKSTKVKELWLQGDTVGAQKAADDAKKYAMWSAIVQVILYVIAILFSIIIGFGSIFANAGSY